MAIPQVTLLCPMQTELTPLVRRAGLRQVPGTGPPAFSGRVGPADVWAMRCGVGTDMAGAAAVAAVGRSPDLVVVLGVAGGVAAATEVGDVVVPAEVLHLDTGGRFRPAQLAGVVNSGLLVTSGTLHHHDALVDLAPADVLAVDMETAAVAAVCHGAGVPWAVVRGISDLTRERSVDDSTLALVRPDGATDAGAAMRLIARQPRRLPALTRLARGTGRAMSGATAVLMAALSAIA